MELNSIQSAYLAGLFDGEGTFSVFKRKKGKWIFYQPYLEIGMTHKPTLEWVSKQTGKGFIFDGHKPHKKHKQAYKLNITGIDTIIKFIDYLFPYLITKKNVADCVRKFCLSRQGKMRLPVNKRGITEKELDLFTQIRLLNKRGR